MKNNFWVRFVLTKITGIVIFAMGLHFMGAYMSKVLPFEITSSSIVFWGFWMYFGWLIALVMIVGGMYLIFKEIITYWVSKKMKELGK